MYTLQANVMAPVYLYSSLAIILWTTWAGCCPFGPGCVYECHCKSGALCDPTTGHCPDGCDDGEPNGYQWRGAWSGPGCQVGNVAYNQPTTTSTSHPDIASEETASSLAVDGNSDPVHANGHCMLATDTNWHAWLEVNLQEDHIIYNITVYNWDGHMAYISSSDVEIATDSSYLRCGRIGGTYQLEYQFDCPHSVTARKVRIRRYCSNCRRLLVCEVMVIGFRFQDCRNNAYGPGCLRECHCDSQCNAISGLCPTNCEPGWQGSDCQTPCDPGTWGIGCSLPCACLDTQEVCNHINGHCEVSGCAERHVGTGCDGVIPSMETSEITTGVNGSWLEVSFTAWEASHDRGDPPSGYLLQIRQDDSEAWVDTLVLDSSHAGLVEVNFELELAGSGNYSLQVLPLLTHENVTYEGWGPMGNFQYTGPTVAAPTGSASDSAVVISVIVVLVCLVCVGIVVGGLLWRRRNLQTKGIVENGETEPESPPDEGSRTNVALGSDGETNAAFAPDATYGNDYANQAITGRPVKVEDIASYFDGMKAKPGAFKFEYTQIPNGVMAKCEVGKMTVNLGKNRFNNILAYDNTRVVLEDPSGSQGSGYINANYIPGYHDPERGYIATQGPRIHTISDMWRMIWQLDVNRVVMVTDIMEGGKAKSEVYWPDSLEANEENFGEFKIKLLKVTQFADYAIRKLSVKHKGSNRPLTHFHFQGWGDHKAPLVAMSLLELRRKIRDQDDYASGPMVVHCSAGVGRTGTFIALDYLLDQAKAEGEVDVFKYVTTMRTCRVNMVQSLEQYIFIYNALLQALVSGDSMIPSHQMAELFPALMEEDPDTGVTRMEKQFTVLNSLKVEMPKEEVAGNLPENLDKNRDSAIIPANHFRVCLMPVPTLEDAGDYINAVFVDGYRSRRANIVTQIPLENTIRDFWRLIYDHKSSTLVLLNDLEDTACLQYWPSSENKKIEYDPLVVELESEEEDMGVTLREFKISHAKKGGESFTTQQYHVPGWAEDADVPPDPNVILSLLERVERRQQQTGNRPITIQCKYGTTHSGLLCAANFLLEKLKVDQEVDVFLAVAQIRTARSQFINTLKQYTFLYELAMLFMQENDTYANFK